MSRAEYYWRQADICLRLSLLSEDEEIADLLINKALQFLSQADAATEGAQGTPPAHMIESEHSAGSDKGSGEAT
jgi:hypothetical protein